MLPVSCKVHYCVPQECASRMSLAIVLCVAPTDLDEDRPLIKNDVTAIPLTGLFTLLTLPLTPLQTARLMWQTFQ